VENSAPAAPAGSDLPADFPLAQSLARKVSKTVSQAHQGPTPKERIHTGAASCGNHGHLRAGVYLGTTSGSIFHSRDAGSSWQLLQDHLPPVMSLEAAVV